MQYEVKISNNTKAAELPLGGSAFFWAPSTDKKHTTDIFNKGRLSTFRQIINAHT